MLCHHLTNPQQMVLVRLGSAMLCFVIETDQVAAMQQTSKPSKSWEFSSDQPISANANEVLEDAFRKKGKTAAFHECKTQPYSDSEANVREQEQKESPLSVTPRLSSTCLFQWPTHMRRKPSGGCPVSSMLSVFVL